jgi:dihydroorotate dehydrogenase
MIYRSLLRPLLFRLEPETAHDLATTALRRALSTETARRRAASYFSGADFGELQRFGLKFKNPVGLAAGFDKNGILTTQLAALGFGFLEVGTTTFHAQPGNPRPRLFRLSLDRALINRAGFNNDGAEALARQLESERTRSCVVGVNIGKSRVVEIDDAIADYLATFDLIFPVADYVAVNVSSPNTPRLRELQKADALSDLLGALEQRNSELAARANRSPLPLLVKISPDTVSDELEMIVAVAREKNLRGIIATNTTVNRTGLRTPLETIEMIGAGGLSGAPLRRRSTETIAALYRLTQGSGLIIIGVGGIFTAEDAWEKITAGASLVQLYTGLVYEGIGVVRRINEGLKEILERENFRSLDEAVGCRCDEFTLAA